MEILSVPIIATLVYSLTELLKATFKKSAGLKSFLPLIAGIMGGVFGVVAFYLVPSLIPTANLLYAILVGILSGLSATGSHQIIAQIRKKIAEDKFSQTIENVVEGEVAVENVVEGEVRPQKPTTAEPLPGHRQKKPAVDDDTKQ